LSNRPGGAGTHTASEEYKRLLGERLKYEFDALASKDVRYLPKTYLPGKLNEGNSLD